MKKKRTAGFKVERIVANVAVSDPAAARRFYRDVLGLEVLMDMGWIATYGSRETMTVQVSFMPSKLHESGRHQNANRTPAPRVASRVKTARPLR